MDLSKVKRILKDIEELSSIERDSLLLRLEQIYNKKYSNYFADDLLGVLERDIIKGRE